jgi:hypothetical protein
MYLGVIVLLMLVLPLLSVAGLAGFLASRLLVIPAQAGIQ